MKPSVLSYKIRKIYTIPKRNLPGVKGTVKELGMSKSIIPGFRLEHGSKIKPGQEPGI